MTPEKKRKRPANEVTSSSRQRRLKADKLEGRDGPRSLYASDPSRTRKANDDTPEESPHVQYLRRNGYESMADFMVQHAMEEISEMEEAKSLLD